MTWVEIKLPQTGNAKNWSHLSGITLTLKVAPRCENEQADEVAPQMWEWIHTSQFCGLFIQCTFESPFLSWSLSPQEARSCVEKRCLSFLSLSEKSSVDAPTEQDQWVNKQTLSFRKEAALHSQASVGSKVEKIQPFAFPEGKNFAWVVDENRLCCETTAPVSVKL